MITSILIGVLLFILKAAGIAIHISLWDYLPITIICLCELVWDFQFYRGATANIQIAKILEAQILNDVNKTIRLYNNQKRG